MGASECAGNAKVVDAQLGGAILPVPRESRPWGSGEPWAKARFANGLPGFKMFKPVPQKIDFPAGEKEILAFWRESQIFEKSLTLRQGAERLDCGGCFHMSTIIDISADVNRISGVNEDSRAID